jgi:hypothetical protein
MVVTTAKHARAYKEALKGTRPAARFSAGRKRVEIVELRATKRAAKSKRPTTALERREKLRKERRERRHRDALSRGRARG